MSLLKKFEDDCIDLFLNKKKGNLWPYFYDSSKNENDLVQGGSIYKENLDKNIDYYLYESEVSLIKEKANLLTEIIGENAVIIEIGTGGKSSFINKALPFLTKLKNLKGYVAIDISQEFLNEISEVAKEKLPNIFVKTICKNFEHLNSEKFPKYENSVLLFKGSTIGNFMPEQIPVFLSKLRKLSLNNNYLVITNDTNNDYQSLYNAYYNPYAIKFHENIMFKIKRDLKLDEFDATAFEYKPKWISEKYDFRHILVAKKIQNFLLKEHKIDIKVGDEFHVMSSFKYPIEFFQNMVSQSGFKVIKTITDSKDKMAMHLFKSI